MSSLINPLDRDVLRTQFQSAQPFPFMKIDNFLDAKFADEVSAAYPKFETAVEMGSTFSAVNENRKVQVVDYAKFPSPVKRLSDALASPDFMADLGHITGIPKLVWDAGFAGGGMHETDRSGWLDVHVDFNYNDSLQMHRRLNILVYLNPAWDDSWGGALELWGDEVKVRAHMLMPVHNRCVVFATSERSWHGVTAVSCPPGEVRKSFAAYYYTREAPAEWDGKKHSTVFRTRPDEYMKRHVLMPAEQASRSAIEGLRAAKGAVKRLLNRS